MQIVGLKRLETVQYMQEWSHKSALCRDVKFSEHDNTTEAEAYV